MMNTSEKLVKIAENQQKVYDKGFEDGKESGGDGDGVDWDIIQNYGNRKDYTYAFSQWATTEINPKHMVAPTGSYASKLFRICSKLKKVDWKKFDFSNATNFDQMCSSCFELEEIDTELIPASLDVDCWNYTFSSNFKLKTIKKVKSFAGHKWNSTFVNNFDLEEIRFTEDSEIANNISFADSPKLSRESCISILEALGDVEGTTLTFSSSMYFRDRMKAWVLGNGKAMTAESQSVNGVRFEKITDTEFKLSGTATDSFRLNLLDTPIVIQDSKYGAMLMLSDRNGNFSDRLEAIIQSAENGTYILYGADIMKYRLDAGDIITSVNFPIDKGENFGDGVYCSLDFCFVDYYEAMINSDSPINNWTIVY